LDFVAVSEGLLAQVAVGGGGPYPPSYFFIVAVIKYGLFLFACPRVNSGRWLPWFLF
jgi:hypothetical protein